MESAEVAERIKIAQQTAQQQVDAGAIAGAKQTLEETGKQVATLSGEDLEKEINRILGIKAQKDRDAKIAAAKPPEPDWATLDEVQATNLNLPFNVEVIEHEVPAYMDIRLKDPEYVAVWANRDQRRLGELFAQGYEILKSEHIDSDFKLPLRFDSENCYTYMDVIALRVHKRILFAKRRRVVEKSVYQLRALQAVAKSKVQDKMDTEDPLLGNAFRSGRMGFYDAGGGVDVD